MARSVKEKIKIGTYICQGCDLGNRLDTVRLASIATREGKATLVKQHAFLCGEKGIEMIRSDLASGEINRVMVAACSHRAKTDAFNFDGIATNRTNLREGVIWIRPENQSTQETTQEMAEDYIRMGCAELKFMATPHSSKAQNTNRHILVVGGGITGMTAALEAAKAGYPISLIEKTHQLGGIAAQLHKRVPNRSPYTTPQDTEILKLTTALENHRLITIYLNSTINQTRGAPGRFEVELTTPGHNTEPLRVGSIIQASGFKPYDANQLTELSYPRSADIMTQLELEALAKVANGRAINRPSDNKTVKSVVFIQCAGQRSQQTNHLPYCSAHCCHTSIKQALYFKQQNPDIETTILYTDLRTPGVAGEAFLRHGQNQGVIFIKGSCDNIEINESVNTQNPSSPHTNLQVNYQNLILKQQLTLSTDLVVLATGMQANAGINLETKTSLSAEAPTSSTDRPSTQNIPVESILNLNYRQGTDLPQLAHGFADSHFICFPYETRRTGIYAAGPVRRPMDIQQAQEDATGAAMKAIQAVENAGLGQAAHPRSGDLSYPSFDKQGCTQCKRCSVECPFAAIDEDERGYPQYNESRCRRCGTCMGACPVRVVSFQNYSIQTVGQQIKSVEIPDESEEKPRILVLACENDAYPALDMAAHNRFSYSAFVRLIPVRCLGSVNPIWIVDALNNGYDGVILMGCQKGDDYQCHFVKGSELAHTRMSKVAETLQSLELEQERVAVHEVAISDIQRAPELIEQMVETIHQIGMNPFKF